MALDIRIQNQLKEAQSSLREMVMSGIMMVSVVYLLAQHNPTFAKIAGFSMIVLLIWESISEVRK